MREGMTVRGNAGALPFKDGSFEVVLCTELLEHVPDPKAVVEELYRVLRRGGRCILSTRCCYPLHGGPRDFYRFSRFGLEYLFGGWRIEVLEEDTGALGALTTTLHALRSFHPGESRELTRVGTRLGLAFCEVILRLWRALVGDQDGRLCSGYRMIAVKSCAPAEDELARTGGPG